MSLNALNMYEELCRIDTINNGYESKFPYTLKDNAQYTHHEITLNYKQNYCQSIKILQDKKHVDGGDSNDISYMYVLYDDFTDMWK